MRFSGYIEGYYGRILNWTERHNIIEFLHLNNLNTYFYCPKEDPFHRSKWMDPYPNSFLYAFQNFSDYANAKEIKIIFGISPGELWDASQGFDKLKTKIQTFKKIGIKYFCILFDDISKNKEDGILHSDIINQCLDEFPDLEFSCVPSQYCASMLKDGSDYLDGLNQCNLKAPFFWTGDQVIHSDYASRKINLWKKNFSKDRKIIIWDNTFANDYCTPKIVLQEYENPPIDNDELDGFLINATGIKPLDTVFLAVLSNYFQMEKKQSFDEVLARFLPQELLQVKDLFAIELHKSKVYDHEKLINQLLWDWHHDLKEYFYPYLHLLKKMIDEKSSTNFDLLEKRFRIKS